MISYKAVPNTDGQILIPASQKPPIIPKAKFSRTVPPSRGAIPVSRSGALTQPTSPQVHGTISRSNIPGPGSLQSRQHQISSDNLDEEQERRGAAARRFRAVTPRSSNFSIAAPRIPDQKITARKQEDPIFRERKASAETDHEKNFNKMSLSYVMGPLSMTPRLAHIPEGNKAPVIDLTLSSEGEDQSKDINEKKENSPVHIDESNARQYHYSSLPTNNRPNRPVVLEDFNAKCRTISPDVVVPVQDSPLNSPVKHEGVEKVDRNFELEQNMETADMASFRASRTLPKLPIRRAGCHQSHSRMMTSSPLCTFDSTPKAASSSLSNLEHAAVNTLVNLNHGLDLNKSNSIMSFKQLYSPNRFASTHQSPGVLTRKRPSCLISTPTSALALNFKSPVSSMTELEPATKRICINSLLNSPSSSSFSPPPAIFAPDAPTPSTQIVSPLLAQSPSRLKDGLASDQSSDYSTLTPPPSSNFYPSPPASPSLKLAPMRSIPRPLVPRTSQPSNPVSNLSPNPQSHLLFFDHEAYSPLPIPSQSPPRSSSAPPTFSVPCSSASPNPHPRHPPRRNLACRAWKLSPSRFLLSGHGDFLSNTPDTPDPPQYLVIIRDNDHSNRIPSSTSPNEDGNVRNWWAVVNGKEDMEEIRKLFQQ